ncbi:MAG: helix-turn-helix domain-containing protein [Pseudomonadota bacterium]
MVKPHRHTCPVAAMLNIFGDHWTWLVVREAFYGATRFGEFRRQTGIAKNLLAERLSLLVDEAILEKHNISETGTRYEYRLTQKGQSLLPVFLTMSQWGNEHMYGFGNEPVEIIERANGRPLEYIGPTDADGQPLGLEDLAVKPGPGANRAARRRLTETALAPINS